VTSIKVAVSVNCINYFSRGRWTK